MAANSVSRRAARPTREVTGRMVFVCLVTFFGIVAGVNAIMIRAAVSTFGGVETESSYQAGLTFARESLAAHAQDELGWQVVGKVTRDGDAKSVVEVAVRDPAGAPLANLSASAQLVHPTDRRFDHVVPLSEMARGRFAGSTASIAGQWDLVVELARDGRVVFRSKNRIFVR